VNNEQAFHMRMQAGLGFSRRPDVESRGQVVARQRRLIDERLVALDDRRAALRAARDRG
jgi:hypothetical protein